MKKSKRSLVFLIAVMTMVSLSTNAFAWKGEAHQDFVTDNWSSTFSNNYGEKAAFLLGSTFADIQDKNDSPFPYDYLLGKGSLHGGLWSKGTEESGECNYIACYTYLTKVAVDMGNLSNVKEGTASIAAGMTSNDFNSLKGYVTYYKDTDGKWKGIIGGYNFNTVFSYYGLRNNSYTRKAFVYGLALHVATDAFAHSAWEPNSTGTSWTRIKHVTDSNNMDAADDPEYVSSRYTAAEQVAKNVMSNYKNSTVGTVYDFILSEQYYNGTFLLGNFYKSASKANYDEYTSDMYKVYSSIDLYIKCLHNGWSYLFK